MWSSALQRYRCTRCAGGDLSAVPRELATTQTIVEGSLTCDSCGTMYPVKAGIPRFVPRENYADTFGYQWNIHRTTQLDSHTGLAISRNRLFGVTDWSTDLHGQHILEAGSGAGRFTEILVTTGATIFSFDYSSAVDANFASNGRHPNLNLFQGDLFKIPVQPQAFDKVLCLGVIQHTPDPARAFASLAAQVRPGGELVIDVYTRSFVALLQWKYLLRPLTRRMRNESLYALVSSVVPVLLPVAAFLRKIAGRLGARLVPIVEYSHLGLPAELNTQWAILDTFDMYSPAHDHPQSLATVRRWFEHAGFEQVAVHYGPNGVVGKGTKPLCAA